MSKVVNGLITATLLLLTLAGFTVILSRQFNQPTHSPAITLDGTQHPRGATLTATTQHERITVPGAEIILEPKAAITLISCTATPCTFRHDTGKITVSGQARFTVRTHTIAVNGEATLTHYSWKDEWNVSGTRGALEVDGKGYNTQDDITVITK